MAYTSDLRPHLGDFSSIVCFRALVVGVENIMGRDGAMVALKGAGRQRGRDLVASLGLTGKGPKDPTEAAKMLDFALGIEGTRLCSVNKVETDGDGGYTVYMTETVCSADEPQGSTRELSFTFGAMQGAIEALYGVQLRGRQIGSVLRGQEYDILEFEPR